MQITLEYSGWFVLLCLLLAAIYSLLLYFRENRLAVTPGWLKAILAAVRFVAVFLIAFLLLGPLLQSLIREVEKPIVILATDNSQSIVAGADSNFYKNEFKNRLQELKAQVGQDFEVRSYTFGAALNEQDSLDFAETATSLSAPLEELADRYSNRNVGAVILATDGIYNLGANPLYTGVSALRAPVYPIALGDTTLKRDLLIREVASNQIAFLHNQFPIEVMVAADKLAGSSAVLTISHKGEIVFEEKLNIDSDAYTKTVRALPEAMEVGVQRYTVRLSGVAGEENSDNNSYEVFVEVLDSRQKILIVANAPHPDVFALQAAVGANENYEVELQYAGALSASAKDFNLVILHELPSVKESLGHFLEEFIRERIPMFLILGSQSNFNRLKDLPIGATVVGFNGRMNEVYPKVNSNFTAFRTSDEFSRWLQGVPPVSVPFGKVVAAGSAEVLLYQQVGSVQTADALLAVNQVDGQKNAVMLGTGMWRWRLMNYATEENTDLFDGFIGSLVQYLALKTDKSFFRISSKNRFLENEDIIIQAELYNPSYELINDAPVTLQLKNEAGEEYDFTFSTAGNAYRLNAGRLPPGRYTYVATASRGSEQFTKTGVISISPFHLEKALTRANHGLLYNLAEKTGGRLYYPAGMDQLAEQLNAENIQSVSYSREVYTPAINLKWLFFLILALLTFEWFVRKRQGAY